MALTKIECDRAACPSDQVRIRLTDDRGMYLEVTQSGGKYWRLKYRHGGKEKRLALGVYPSVTLAQAREAREAARLLLSAGQDPGAVKRQSKRLPAADASHTFEAIARTWWARWSAGKNERHAGYVLRRLEADAFPVIGSRPIGMLEPLELVDMARKIETRGSLDIARRVWQSCGQVFEYAMTVKGPDGRPLAARNPAREIRPGAALLPRIKTNFARVDAKEMPALLRKIEAYDSTLTRLAMKLLALTFVRTGELIGGRWDEIDFKLAEWRIPKERMKMPTPHIVPLAPQAVEVLQALHTVTGHRALMFPGERDHDKTMSNGAILMALRRMGYAGRMTGHGFRGVASTVLHELGHRHDVIELQLAHMERNDVSAAYNHATYMKERRALMNVWADHLDLLRRSPVNAFTAKEN